MKSSNQYWIATPLLVAALLCGWSFHSFVYAQQDEDQQQTDITQTAQSDEAEQQDEQEAQDEENDEQSADAKEFKKIMGVTLTADELIEKMHSAHASFAGDGELKGEELEKAKTNLRNRFAFESIRDRMSFQKDSVPQSIRRNDGTDGEIPILSQRGRALAALHSEEVDDFINRPGQGFRRSRIISPYDLELRSQWAKRIDTQPVDSKLLSEPTISLEPSPTKTGLMLSRYSMSDSGMPSTDVANLFHNESARGFADRYSLGLVKSLDQVAGFESHQTRFPKNWNGSIRIQPLEFFDGYAEKPNRLDVDWKINRLQLVSLLLHDEPRVYLSENLPNMEELSGTDVKTRKLNDFESTSLKKLIDGEELVTQATPNRLVMIGALRADASCMQCHSIEENELLGAFSYEFLRNPPVEIRVEDH